MSTWLKLLPMELDSVQTIIEPEHEIEKGERVVGNMPVLTRKLYTLGRLLEKDANQNRLDSHFCTDKEQKVQLMAKAAEYLAKSQVIKELMWIGIRDELGIWGENIGVRIGFEVVIMPESADDDMPPFLKRLLGGGL